MSAETRLTSANEREIKRVTFIGMIINIALSALKFAAGIFGNSQALVADAFHSLSDCVTDVAVLIGSSYWSAPPDETHPHGHRRIETVITVFIGLALVVVALMIGWNAVSTMMDKDNEPPEMIAFIAAVLSIGTKEGLYQWTAIVGKKVKSSAMIANAWHHRSDAFSSIPAAVAIIAAILLPGYGFIDHIGAMLVCLFILHAAYKISWTALCELTDAGASQKVCDTIELLAKQVEGVKDVHKCRTRYLGSGLQVDLHVLVDPELSVREGHDISAKVKEELIKKGPEVIDVVVHLEPFE
ncbi:MAG TPA: cation diffusion facilitator family transporter [bacterium]|nr:cation diffusion facilitator family transporter [bacterium]HPS29835.1 cation diffusion facilitator family transporter [bacterium]